MNAALYCRVSTQDQDADNQLSILREWCSRNGHIVVAEFLDIESGGKGADKRAQLAAMLAAAQRRSFQIVVVWALDRLSREGMVKTVGYLQTLATHGVGFHSFSEPALSSENELTRDVVLAVMAALAKAERQRISDRTKAGLERVRRNGSKSGAPIGRPMMDSDIVARIRKLRAANPELAANSIAVQLGIDPKTARKYLAAP